MDSVSLAEKMAKRKGLSKEAPLVSAQTKLEISSESMSESSSFVQKNTPYNKLNLIDLGLAIQSFFEKNPEATKLDAATWAGFENINSGRVKISNALKLLSCDPDIISDVKAEAISARAALKVQALRNDSAIQKSNTVHRKAKSKNKPSSLNVPLDNLKIAHNILQSLALKNGIEINSSPTALDRKKIIKFFSEENLSRILNTVENQS